METPRENARALPRLRPGESILFEFGRFLFAATIDDTSRLEAQDELLVTIYSASDAQFSDYLPTQLWLKGVSRYLNERRMLLVKSGEYFAWALDSQDKLHPRMPV
jgi:hypothetical protein